MNTDQLAYEIFVADPGSYFEMIGEPRSEAEHYVFHAVDFKAIERRLDGYFEPKDAHRPLHFAEVLFYKKENAYANLFAKVFLKLEQEPTRDWRAVIFFESESLLPKVETPYEDLLGSKRVKRVYLQTLPEGPKSGFGLSILKLVTKPKVEILHDANLLVKRLKQKVKHQRMQAKLREWIEVRQGMMCVLGGMAQVSDGGEEEAPDRDDRPGAQRHRRTFSRVIPWLDARQQSQPPFHPARRRYRKRVAEARATNVAGQEGWQKCS